MRNNPAIIPGDIPEAAAKNGILLNSLPALSFPVTFVTGLKGETLYRLIAVTIMFTAFFAQTFSSSLIVANYYTHTEAFAKNCENKDRPGLHCNGKCQMIKQVKAEEKKDQQNPERKDNKNEVVFCVNADATIIPKVSATQPASYLRRPTVGKEIKMPRSLFRPPLV